MLVGLGLEQKPLLNDTFSHKMWLVQLGVNILRGSSMKGGLFLKTKLPS